MSMNVRPCPGHPGTPSEECLACTRVIIHNLRADLKAMSARYNDVSTKLYNLEDHVEGCEKGCDRCDEAHKLYEELF
jgi:archaellum component FlaC